MAEGKPRPDPARVRSWLEARFGPIEAFDALSGGFWSSAWAFSAGGTSLVLRLSDVAESFSIDHAATAFSSPDLPVPDIVDRGTALGHQFAVSRRHYGTFPELAPADAGKTVGVAMAGLLQTLRAVPPRPEDRGAYWYSNEDVSWHDALMRAVRDNPGRTTSGWTEKLREHTRAFAAFTAASARVRELLPQCPVRTDLVHSDLLHQNVLVDESWSQVTGVFSWKCSMRGDFLYDVAWCTFWSAWHPGIAAADLWQRTLAAGDLDAGALEAAALRHHCYELQVAASHFGWHVWTEDLPGLQRLTLETERVLQRGALDGPA